MLVEINIDITTINIIDLGITFQSYSYDIYFTNDDCQNPRTFTRPSE